MSIKLEHVVLASPEQMEFIIEGMRNPMNSWNKTDSFNGCETYKGISKCLDCDGIRECGAVNKYLIVGENDHSLMQRLSNAGTDHRKFMRMLPAYVRITAPLYWWKEFDTYKVGTVANSCSTMHKIQAKEFTMDDFSCEHLDIRTKALLEETIKALNDYRKLYIEYNADDFEIKGCPSKKDIWWQMIQLLPSSYNQTRNVMMNYEVLANIYKSRRGHKLDEWCDFCKWIETLPYSEIIMSSSGLDLNSINALQGAARNSSKGYIHKRKTEDRTVKRMVKVKDILPLVKWNDVRLVLGEEDEICLLRKEFITETLSDKILEMTVTGIENDEAILDTVNIYVFGYKTED